MTASSKKGSSKGSAATVAIVLVTSLFFVWGLTMNLVNALNSPMANYLELSGTEASLLQVASRCPPPMPHPTASFFLPCS